MPYARMPPGVLDTLDKNNHDRRLKGSARVFRALIRRADEKAMVRVSVMDLARELQCSAGLIRRHLRYLRSSTAPYISLIHGGKAHGDASVYHIVATTISAFASSLPPLVRDVDLRGLKPGTHQKKQRPIITFVVGKKACGGRHPNPVPPVVPADIWVPLVTWPNPMCPWGLTYQQVSDWRKGEKTDPISSYGDLIEDGNRIAGDKVPCVIWWKPDGNIALFRAIGARWEFVKNTGRIVRENDRLRAEINRVRVVDPIVRAAADYRE